MSTLVVVSGGVQHCWNVLGQALLAITALDLRPTKQVRRTSRLGVIGGSPDSVGSAGMTAELADYERMFRRAGVPLFIVDFSATRDVLNRFTPLFALVSSARWCWPRRWTGR